MEMFDVVIVGAGAAGLFCAGVAGQLGQSLVPTRPALVPLTFSPEAWVPFAALPA